MKTTIETVRQYRIDVPGISRGNPLDFRFSYMPVSPMSFSTQVPAAFNSLSTKRPNIGGLP